MEERKYRRIRNYFENKTVFLTGGSGFIGRVLIEKLLRSCPGVQKVYVLLRPKRGLSVQERMDKLFSVELFDKLDKETNGAWRKKVQLINGDVMELNLGISKEDEKILVDNVNIFYHIAASVRFDDPLTKAIIMNTRGTREASNLALKMKNIDMFIHVSTTFCNVQKDVVEEKLYPPVADWKKMIYLAEIMDEQELRTVSLKLMDPFPNTYTFTKHLGEHVVHDLCHTKIPALIVRPSVVIATIEDPISGWVDNFNGGGGMLVASGKGILRVSWGNPDARVDYIAVDYAVKLLIMLVYYRKAQEDELSLRNLKVCNVNADLNYAICTKQTIKLGKELIEDIPISNPLWYPGGNMTSCKYNYFLQLIFLHLLPALLVDLILRIAKYKPILFRIQKKVYVTNSAFYYFISKEWYFRNETMFKARDYLSAEDREDFHFRFDVDHKQYFRNACLGGKKYLLHENLDDLDKHRKRMKQMKVLHYVTKTLLWMLLFYFIYNHLNFITSSLQAVLHKLL